MTLSLGMGHILIGFSCLRFLKDLAAGSLLNCSGFVKERIDYMLLILSLSLIFFPHLKQRRRKMCWVSLY